MFVVGDRMTRKVVTANSAETLTAAASKMEAGNFRRLPVVDAGKLVGIVSEFDLKRFAGALDSTLIENAMTPDPITLMPSDTPQHAAALMQRHEVGALPVIHAGKVVGIVTARTSCCPNRCQSPSGIRETVAEGEHHPPWLVK
jgi:CBS domain-containing protein